MQKIEITNIRYKYSRINEKFFDLDDFDNQRELLTQHQAYISNFASTKNGPDFSLNNKCQQAAKRHEFLTNVKSERIYIERER